MCAGRGFGRLVESVERRSSAVRQTCQSVSDAAGKVSSVDMRSVERCTKPCLVMRMSLLQTRLSALWTVSHPPAQLKANLLLRTSP